MPSVATWSSRTNNNNRDRNVREGWDKVDEFGLKLGIKADTKERAKDLVAKVEDSGKLKGKNLDAKIAAIIVVAGT